MTHEGYSHFDLPAATHRGIGRQIAEGLERGREAPSSAPPLLEWGRLHLAEHFRLPPSAMHVWLSGQVGLLRSQRGVKLNVIGPRGGAKSTLITLSYVLQCALSAWEPYIWIVSDTRAQAVGHLHNLKQELQDNRRLLLAHGLESAVGPVWRSAAIELANGVAIEAFGTGQKVRGRRWHADRPTLIVCDDLQNDGHMASALLREQTRDWFAGTLLKAGTPRTNVVHLATALHQDALALRLHRTPGWISRIFRSIETWPANMQLWHAWEALYADVEQAESQALARRFFAEHHDEMTAGAELLWPEHEDLYALMCMRVEAGAGAFEREKQGSPVNPALCEWPEAYFAEHIWFDDWPGRLLVKTLALDPSKGADARRGDYSAYVRLGLDRWGLLYVEADLARRPTPQMVADGVEHCRAFVPDAFGVEANQFQELLAGEFAAAFAAVKLLRAQPWLLDNHTNKLVRIRRLGSYLSSRRLRFKSGSPSTRMLVEQLKMFPTGDHDDGPDALEMAIRLAAEMLDRAGDGDGLGDRLPLGTR